MLMHSHGGAENETAIAVGCRAGGSSPLVSSIASPILKHLSLLEFAAAQAEVGLRDLDTKIWESSQRVALRASANFGSTIRFTHKPVKLRQVLLG
jgi:hypothetical protein